jgi:hypothetical protein
VINGTLNVGSDRRYKAKEKLGVFKSGDELGHGDSLFRNSSGINVKIIGGDDSMSKTARKGISRQDIENTLQKIANDQQAYYQAWATEWANLIAYRARNDSSRRKKREIVDSGITVIVG